MNVFADARALSDALARAVVEDARQAIGARGRFTIAISGGETPRAAYELLGSTYAGSVPWDAVDVCYTDERFVPPEDPRNNHGMASRAWLDPAGVPPERVHAIPTTAGTPAACAAAYERTLEQVLGGRSAAMTFDLAIMGIGADGHTASLFPGDAAALSEAERWVLAVTAPPGVEVAQRITLTLPVLNASRRMLFVASGTKKRAMVARAAGGPAVDAVPASRAKGRDRTNWFVDRAAASGPDSAD